jgi:hypothetical protein
VMFCDEFVENWQPFPYLCSVTVTAVIHVGYAGQVFFSV